MRKLLILATVLGLFSAALVRAETPATPAPQLGHVPYASLSEDEREILAGGEISHGRYIGGGITGSIVGLGIGQAIQGTYIPRGLIFTLAEAGSLSLMIWGAADCYEQAFGAILVNTNRVNCHSGALVAGALIFTGFR